MTDTEETREQRAAAAGEEEIAALLNDPSPRVIKSLLANRNITEEDVLAIAARKNLPGGVLESIAKDRRWSEKYPIRLALARNPKTPLFSALSIVRYLRLFDQVELTRSSSLPIIFRQKIEAIIMEKVPALALGVKKSLAKIASGNVLIKLIQDGYPEVVRICLSNPHLVEAHLYKVISREGTGPAVIRLIADHPNWSNRYNIKYSLIRNEHTPLSRSVTFLSGMKTKDLKELFAEPSLPVSVKPCIYRELWERGEDAEKAAEEEEKVFEIEEDEAADLESGLSRFEADPGGHEPVEE
jgi:hypothetical protein